MDDNFDVKRLEDERSPSPAEVQSPLIDRNPSPPPDTADGEDVEAVDAIGETIYSKHWLFSTLTRLINMATENTKEDSEGQMQLSEDDEEDLCKVWDMAMDKDVAGFLQEFKATDILLGVIAKSCNPRLTEICVGILGNIACFPETCLTLSQNDDLGAVLLLLLGDADPPTLLEMSRLLLTCVSQEDVCSLWLQRIGQQPSVCPNLCFIMCSSTNTDLLEKVGELVDKLFDLDEELMRSWITAQPSKEDDAGESRLEVASCLLEAAKQLRPESPNGLEVYLHIFQLLTTIDEGIQVLGMIYQLTELRLANDSISSADPDGPGKALWDFISDVLCEDLCKPSDLSVVLQEQKSILVQAFSVLQALYRCQENWCNKTDTNLALTGTILRVLQYHREGKDDDSSTEKIQDEQLQILAEVTAEFLADMCDHISKDAVADLIKKGFLTEKTCLTAAACLHGNFKTSFEHLHSLLSETDPQLADVVRKQFPV